MRFSNSLLSLAFLVIIGSISAQMSITGTWTNPYSSKTGNSYCCIPTSIEVSSTGTDRYTAYYKYPNMDSKCFRLFMSQSSGQLTLYKRSSYYSDNYYSETTFWGSMTFNFMVSNSSGSPSLNIYTADSSSYNGCDFTMYSPNYNNSSGSNKTGSLLFFILFFIVITASAAFKNYQKRQSSVIIAQNLAQPQPQTNVNIASYNFNPAPNNIYVAPTVPTVQVHQQFVQPQVTQVTYTAPGQFIPANAHYSGNGGF